jgi:hypothetical protein
MTGNECSFTPSWWTLLFPEKWHADASLLLDSQVVLRLERPEVHGFLHLIVFSFDD